MDGRPSGVTGTPGLEHLLDVVPNLLASRLPAATLHQQVVVRRVPVPDGRDHGAGDGTLVQRPARRRAPHSTAPPRARVPGNLLRAPGRAAREESEDLLRHPRLEVEVLHPTPLLGTLPTALADLLVREALLLGSLQRRLLDQDALPLVASAGAAEPDYHGGEPALLLGPPAERWVARGQEA